MKFRGQTAGLLLIAALLGSAAPALGEEITLKNGQKIVGTIIGYEKDMFRVETDYGIAMIRKDKVASIEMTPPATAKSEIAKPEATPRSVAKTVNAQPAPGTTPHTDSTAERSAAAPLRPTAPPPMAVKVPTMPALQPIGPPAAPPVAVRPPASPVVTATLPLPPPPPVSHPLDVPMPTHLQEHVDGNTYFSDSFQFSMFKPPDWKIFEGVPKETGSGIMAMGTDDEQTLLIVDRQVWSGTPKLTSDQVEARLRQTYQEYRRISEDAVECDGHTATRRTFTGILDGAEWHGVAVHVIRGNTVFGIIGLTSADTFQFQEAVFNKIIKTFHFLAPDMTAGPLSTANPTR